MARVAGRQRLENELLEQMRALLSEFTDFVASSLLDLARETFSSATVDVDRRSDWRPKSGVCFATVEISYRLPDEVEMTDDMQNAHDRLRDRFVELVPAALAGEIDLKRRFGFAPSDGNDS